MADIDARRADIAQARFSRAQPEFNILVIAARIEFRHRADALKTGARDIKAKADAVGQIDHA